MRLLLVEDDAMIGKALVQALERDGTAVDWVRTGRTALDAIATREHAIVLLDLGLPDFSGLEVLATIRSQREDVPVLVITARDALDDRIRGLDLGADDYLVKPFAAAELMARIRALTRRRQGATRSQLVAGALSLDLATREMQWRDASCVLPAREFALMSALMERPGAILSRSQLEIRLYDWRTEIESNAVDVLIHSIRKRFDKSVIRNVRGAGWMVLKSPT